MSRPNDKSWEVAQEKAFTAWMNETLAQRNMRLSDLRADLPDGIKLANFLEILAGKKIPTKLDLKPNTRIQKIQNLHVCLLFLENEMQLKNPGCSAEDIADAENKGVKLVLGLLWILYRKYRIAVITHKDKSSEEGLLLWCKNITEGYNGIHIDNFKNSFNDGMAFLAMVHRFSPDKTEVNFDSLSKDNPEQNLTMAFDLAEKEMGIPKLLDVHDLMDGRVDERSLVLYTSLFFHAFKAAAVANDLAQAKASTEETLASEKKKNEELRSANSKLEERIVELTSQLEEQTKKTDSLAQQLEEEKQKTSSLEERVRQLSSEIQIKEETNLQLQSAKTKLEEELHSTKLRLDSETQSRQEKEKQAGERQNQDEQHIHELKKKTAVFEEEIESLKNDIEGFKVQLDNERKDKADQRREIEEKAEQDNVHRKGLQVLRKNLDQHIEDLHTWRKYMDTKEKTSYLDFEREVRPVLQGELEGKDFVEQLNLVSGKLDQENEAMLKLLKMKLAEAKQAELEAKKSEVK